MKKIILLITVMIFSSAASAAKDKDQFWMCGSDDAPESIMVDFPIRGAAKVQINGIEWMTTGKDKEDMDGDPVLRFDFEDYKQSFIINVNTKSKSNVRRAGLYSFHDVAKGETATPIQYFCVAKIG